MKILRTHDMSGDISRLPGNVSLVIPQFDKGIPWVMHQKTTLRCIAKGVSEPTQDNAKRTYHVKLYTPPLAW